MSVDWLPTRPAVREVLDALSGPVDREEAQRALVRSAGSDAQIPWYVKALVGVGSSVAVGLVLLFLFTVELVSSATSATVIGAVVLCGAVAGRWLLGPGWHQISLWTLAVVGEVLIITGLVIDGASLTGGAAIVLGLQAAMIAVFPDRLHRFLSAIACVVAVAVMVSAQQVPYALDLVAVLAAVGVHALVIARPALEAHPALPASLRTGLGPLVAGLMIAVFGLMLASGWVTALTSVEYGAPFEGPGMIATLGITGVTLWSGWRILGEHLSDRPGDRLRCLGLIALALAVLCALTLRTPGVVLALGLLAVTFHRRETLLLSLSVVFLVGFGALYYYDLSLTLLAKSGALVGAGILLLGLRALLLWRLRPRHAASVPPPAVTQEIP